ncbi:hypothetical protein HNR12_001362 [Streptomonospora nanhaiensis]|uniref:Uncharacterized protein n=1 Tax=Streptomonospora nanhaiensis TaxID=1323731 RepID=A0A853BK31_9ACTN|nr:hypothetical protein [Streptomonospora nanhaiensis]NYI95085.1 hypothetical protein [Streptomonospora nanhaiensis]
MTIDGCWADGHHNDIECTITGPPDYPIMAGVEMEFTFARFLFAGPPEKLPTPPEIPPGQELGHCDDWHDWVVRRTDMYVIWPTVLMEMDTGIIDVLKVDDIELTPIRRYEAPEEWTDIECQFGAGLNPGYWISADTRNNEVTVSDQDGEFSGMAMPPASITLQEGQSQNAAISFISHSGMLYEGTLSVTAEVNGVEDIAAFGSQEMPIRWVGRDGTETDLSGDTYTWDVKEKEWKENFRPIPGLQ